MAEVGEVVGALDGVGPLVHLEDLRVGVRVRGEGEGEGKGQGKGKR